MVRHSLSFLQDADIVSEVANSKYHSLFFILIPEESFKYEENPLTHAEK